MIAQRSRGRGKGQVLFGLGLYPFVNKPLREKPLTRYPGRWYPSFLNEMIDLFLINIQVVCYLFGIQQIFGHLLARKMGESSRPSPVYSSIKGQKILYRKKKICKEKK